MSVLRPGGRLVRGSLSRLVRCFGYQLAPGGYPVQRVSVWEAIMRLLDPQGELIVIDGGAHTGETLARIDGLFPRARVWCFEPNPVASAVLRRRCGEVSIRAEAVEAALCDRAGKRMFHIHADDETSSLMSANRAGAELFEEKLALHETIEVAGVAIDAFCAERGIDRIDLLKLDLQGGELDALRGASAMLEGRIRVVLAEVQFRPTYEGAPGADEVIGFMRGAGYRLVGLYNTYYDHDGTAVQGDGLWVWRG